MMAAACRVVGLSISWRLLPMSNPRPIRNGDAVMRERRREPSGDVTSRPDPFMRGGAAIGSSGTGIIAPENWKKWNRPDFSRRVNLRYFEKLLMASAWVL